MPNPFFQFKQFKIIQQQSAMKVTTEACLFGAWTAAQLETQNFETLADEGRVKNLLDIGSGTGLLTLMLAQKIRCAIDAIELQPEAAAEAQENFLASPWADRLNSINADVRDFEFRRKYRLIISNPPFMRIA